MEQTTKTASTRRKPNPASLSGDTPKRKTRELTVAHKKAIVDGRVETWAVRRYLESLEQNRPRPGRRPSSRPAARLTEINERIAVATGIEKLKLVQQRIDLETGTLNASDPDRHYELESQFVAVAASYGTRHHISWNAWRQLGVPAATLQQAAITK